MAKVVCFGELMLRLSPPDYQRIINTESFNVFYGGAEANVAVSLANYGINSVFVTRLPDNPIGSSAIGALRKYGVDTQHIIRGGERIGIYFAEKGFGQRASQVYYDRKGSSIQTALPGLFNWDNIFKEADWFHFTGITPALGDNVVDICKEACQAAKAHGVKISCDLNFRKKLWSSDKAEAVMSELCGYVDVCIANEEDAADVFGIRAERSKVTEGRLDIQDYFDVARRLSERFGFEKTAITMRESYSASDNGWSAILLDKDDMYCSKKYNVRIVDRIGSGDAFGAGLIYGCINKLDPQNALEFAVAAGCLKHTIEGDLNLVSAKEVENLAHGDGSGRVVR